MPAISRENESKLSAEYLRSILSYDPETGIFRWKEKPGINAEAGDIAGHARPDGRRLIKIGYIRYLASRLAWLYVYGEWPERLVDHTDRNRANDALANLRQADDRQNRWNSGARSTNKLGLRNITKHRRRYRVGIFQNRKVLYRQSFATLGEAVQARNAQHALICGAFAPQSLDK